ncbi:putative DNA-binding domain-containing protein [Zavarzinia compransoris]|uniref:Putative DNA-binding domain-containing protein n=1 Tax=Zavarzinia compransoris TaxID=1264899 RepID=A0A317EFK5_9PROT|nr:putative DNA-binding domain-containing protein [Zavarzinia compransoris]PWR23965.1 hypothetical protein DKG75_05305 [Zavarzinia compransoris]TDP48217.1 hypothetical protein DES42_102520 [Zavarzinia compransoris]
MPAAELTLAEVQAAFAEGLRRGAMPDALVAAVRGGRVPAARRLQVHRNHVRTSLTAALALHYPVVARLLGPAAFDVVAQRFLAARPPDDPRLALYGAGLDDVLRAQPELAALPMIAEVAGFEWARHGAAQAPAAPILEAATLAARPAGDLAGLRLRRLPSVRLVAARHDVAHLWAINQPGRDGTPEQPLDRPCRLAVWRDQAGAIRAADLGPAEATLLSGLAGDAALGPLLDTVPPDAAAPALARILGLGLLCLAGTATSMETA